MAQLKPPKNYREASPRCCVTCVHYAVRNNAKPEASWYERARADEWNECERDPAATCNSEEDYFRICDYYKAT